MRKKTLSIIILSLCLALVFLPIIIIFIKINETKNDHVHSSYKATIKVELVNEENIKTSYIIKLIDDGQNAIANLNFNNEVVYMQKKNFIYSYNGRYKYLENALTYRDLYKIIGSIDLKGEIPINDSKNEYNPKLDNETINKILNTINLGKNTTEERNAFVILKDDKIEEFALYLTDIKGFKSCNIVINFRKYYEDNIDFPKIDRELLSEGNKLDLSIIKENSYKAK